MDASFRFPALAGVCTAALASCSPVRLPAGAAPLKTASSVDLGRYGGKWYEVARYPQWFQRDCVSATAEYTGKPDGTIRVVNTCLKADGTSRSVEGGAVPVDASNNRLRVTFSTSFYARFIPVPKEGNYWIIDVSPDYRHAIVGTPDRRALWFLSRSPEIRKAELERMKRVAAGQGFDPAKMITDAHTRVR